MRKYRCIALALIVSVSGGAFATEPPGSQPEFGAEFQARSGARLVFEARELPPGVYHDKMVPLPAVRREAAEKIALRESQKLPPKFLSDVGIQAIGVFSSCASRTGDGFRAYDEQLQGYRYFGIYNGRDAVAAAYYTDEQLPLTFHHEVFHHIDGLTDQPDQIDRRWSEVLAGNNLYPPLQLSAADLVALKKLSHGWVLKDAVSKYAEKTPAEDKAETARYFMSALADSLVQMTEQPQLAGSQRLLHVLEKYRRSLNGQGPDTKWFVAVALGREHMARSDVAISKLAVPTVSATITQLQSFAMGQSRPSDLEVRQWLADAETLAEQELSVDERVRLVETAAGATSELLRRMIVPSDHDRKFVVMGAEDGDGINWTLRENVAHLGRDAARLAAIAKRSAGSDQLLRSAQLQNLRLLGRYYTFIAKNWSVSRGTQQVFDLARDEFAAALPKQDAKLSEQLRQLDLVTALSE